MLVPTEPVGSKLTHARTPYTGADPDEFARLVAVVAEVADEADPAEVA